MEQKIKINNNKDQKLVGLYFLNNSEELIIICHGFHDSKDIFAIRELSKCLNKNHYSTFRFDFTGHGESEGSFEDNLIQQVEDVEKVVSYFKNKHKRIVLLGVSLGALVSSLSVMKNKNISKLITINGFFFLNFFNIAWKFSKYLIILCFMSLFKTDVRKNFSFYFKKFIPNNIKIPVLIICGKKDKKINFKQSVKFYSLLNSTKDIKILNNIDHGLTKKEYVYDVGKEIVNWLN